MTLYDRVKELASEQGRSISAVEKEACVANGTIAGWKNGKPYADTLKKVCDVLGYNMDQLINEVQK